MSTPTPPEPTTLSDSVPALLEVKDLRIVYDSPRGPVEACSGVNLTVRPGEFVGIVGESGCGKSTLLFGIAQLLSAPAGVTGG